MPTRNISLTEQQDAFVDEIVKAGKYQNASEAVRDAIRGLQLKLKLEELKVEMLRSQLHAGVEALDQGAFAEVNDAELDTYLDGLVADQAR